MENKKTKKEIYTELRRVDISEFVEKKGGFSYLSWVYALDYMNTHYDEFFYEAINNEETKSPLFKFGTGACVYTKVSVEGNIGIMWLPVLDYSNRPIPYDNINSFQVNTTIMRCLAKNIAINFGLGNFIYQGEDLPIDDTYEKAADSDIPKPKNKTATVNTNTKATETEIAELYSVCDTEALTKYMALFQVSNINDLTSEQVARIIKTKKQGGSK